MSPSHSAIRPRGIIACLSWLVIGISCVPSPAEPGDGSTDAGNPLAVVDGVPITERDLREALELERKPARPGEDLRRKALDRLIDFRAIVARAREAGLERDPTVIDRYEQVLVARYEELETEKRLAAVEPSDEEIAQYYRDHELQFTPPERRRGAQILVSVRRDASNAEVAERRQVIEDALREARELPVDMRDFGEIAARISEDGRGRLEGGDMGWFSRGAPHRRSPVLLDALFSLAEVGEISPVLETPTGFAIVRLTDLEEPTLRPLVKVRDGIRGLLRAEKRKRAVAAYRAAVRGNSKITVATDLEERLEAIDVDSAGSSDVRQP